MTIVSSTNTKKYSQNHRLGSIDNLSIQSEKTTDKHRKKSIHQPRKKPASPELSEPTDTAIEACKFCSFPRFSTVLMPEGHTHFAALRCGSCDGFQDWVEKPANKEKREKRRWKIGELLKSPLISSWEKDFLESVQGRKSLSPKQEEVLDRISGKVGGVNHV